MAIKVHKYVQQCVTMPRLKAACALVLHKLNASCPSSSWQLCEIMNYVLEAVSM
jgi:hypothetical protein